MYVITPKTDDFIVLCDVVLTTQLSSMSKIVFYDINLMPRNLILISDRHQHYTFHGINSNRPAAILCLIALARKYIKLVH